MTSSETPSEVGAPAAPLPKARTRRPGALPGWALATAVVPPGWFFILHTQRWHFTPSAVMLMICWAAIVATGFWALRMALSAASTDDDEWFAVRGKRDELEREKKSLLKALKEIEFDRDTGKLSDADAAALTASYRARAIEVIKAIEAETGAAAGAGSVREQILAEVRARAALDGKVKGGKAKKGKGEGKGKAGSATAAATAAAAAAATGSEAGSGTGSGTGSETGSGTGSVTETGSGTGSGSVPVAVTAAEPATPTEETAS